MTGRMTRQSHFLRDVLKEANQNKLQQKLRYANADQINAVSHSMKMEIYAKLKFA